MAETYTAVGLVATTPRNIVTSEGLSINSFRLAVGSRRFDKESGAWVDGETNWFTVVAFRQLAENANKSLAKGDRVVVSGRLKVRDWDNGERTGTAIEIEADSLGHDLLFGTSTFEKVARQTQQTEDSDSALQPA